jgi:LysM repeat protein
LLIQKQKPTKVVVKEASCKNDYYNVAQETLYGIEKKYDVSDEALKKANPFWKKKDCKLGKHLLFRQNWSRKLQIQYKIKLFFMKFYQKKLHSIAKKYDISIDELEKKNLR